MEFAKVLFGAGFDLFNLNPVTCGIVLGICVIFAIVAAIIRCQVVYVDTDGDYEIEYEKKKWLSKVVLRPASKQGKSFVGWALDPAGENMVAESELLVTHTTVLYAIWATEQEVFESEEKAEGVFVQLNYMDAEGEDAIANRAHKVNTILPEHQDVPVQVKGWSFDKGGEVVLEGEDVSAVFSINLYPVFDENAPKNDKPFNGSAVIELLFIDSATDAFIYKESHYVELNAPEAFASSASFVGWSVEPNGEPIIEKGDNDAVFTIQLYSVTDEAVAEEVVEEAVYEEPVEEVVYEEPAQEEVVYEEPVEEVVYEEPVEEAVYEEPVEEAVYEEPAQEEVVYEEPVQEEAVYEEPVQEEAAIEEAPAEPVEVVPTIVPTYIDNEGNKIEIKYSRSFTANLIQADDTVKDFYGQLKNHIMSFKGVKTKISWKFDSYNKGRDQLFKMKLRGKTILLYCALDPEEFEKSKYHHEAIDNKLFADVPMLLKIKSGLGLRKAKEVINIVMAKYGIEPNPKATAVDYVKEYPYEDNEALLERKLVKVLEADSANVIMSSKKKADDAE